MDQYKLFLVRNDKYVELVREFPFDNDIKQITFRPKNKEK